MKERPKINARQARILAAIVKEYTANPEPVGSEKLEKSYSFGLSSATIRNEMKGLEKSGFISQPHTSAGRVPTDEGYRYFISELMKHAELSGREQTRLLQEVKRLQRQHYELGRSIARLLASSSESAAFALLPEAQASSGFSNIVASDIDKQNLKSVAGFLDNLEHNCRALVTRDWKEVQTFIGSESPIPISEDVSMLVSCVKLPDGRKGIVGIVGSKRMKYAKNISLLEYVSKLISGGALVAILFVKIM
jgi:transcriptional regulator of heat shock response